MKTNHRVFYLMAFAADLWAALWVIENLTRKPSSWEVEIAAQSTTTSVVSNKTIQIWVRDRSQIGIWPDTTTELTEEQVVRSIERQCRDLGEPPSVRLLCKSTLVLNDWTPIVVAIAPHVQKISVAPWPDRSGDPTRVPLAEPFHRNSQEITSASPLP